MQLIIASARTAADSMRAGRPRNGRGSPRQILGMELPGALAAGLLGFYVVCLEAGGRK
jgi:hypothetical protein